MQVSQSDLDSFHSFASEELANDRGLSLEELVGQWRARQERVDAVASIRRGVDDADAGRLHDLDHVDARVRAELVFPPRRR